MSRCEMESGIVSEAMSRRYWREDWQDNWNVDYENERKANLVSGEEIRLGLGISLRMAGMGGVWRVVRGIDWQRDFGRTAEYWVICGGFSRC